MTIIAENQKVSIKTRIQIAFKSYHSSCAQTYIGVAEAPQATPTPTPPAPSMADTYILPATIGIITAIAMAGLVLVPILKKR